MGVIMTKVMEWKEARQGAIEAIQGIKDTVEKHHFEGRIVAPQGCCITVREMLFGWDNFENRPLTEQLVVLGEAQVFLKILDKWIQEEYNYKNVW